MPARPSSSRTSPTSRRRCAALTWRRRFCPWRRRRASFPIARTNTTRATTIFSRRSPRPCAWSTRRSSMPACWCSSTGQVEIINHAVEGLPREKTRCHICWGSWPGPHASDVPFKDIADLVLKVRAGGYSIELANPRHEHEWRLWEHLKLPKETVLIPGVISHATNIVEHPELVAERIVRLARLVGRENVIASTDCGFAQVAYFARVHPQIMWAKLEALVEGARLASKELWPRTAKRPSRKSAARRKGPAKRKVKRRAAA